MFISFGLILNLAKTFIKFLSEWHLKIKIILRI